MNIHIFIQSFIISLTQRTNIVNVIQYLEVNSSYTEEATMLIQITNGDTMSVEVGQIASTYNRIVNFYLFWTE